MPKVLTLISFMLVLWYLPKTAASGALLISGMPSCYSHPNPSHGVPGLFTACPFSCYGSQEYLYCSRDQYCCITSSGCYACCVVERNLNGAEVAGIIIGAIVFACIVLGLTIWISFKFCSKK